MLPRLLAVLTALLLLAGCGGSDDEGAASPPPEETAAPAQPPGDEDGGKRVMIGDDEALLWGQGAYGVVLSHGAAFDAASWSDQASEIAAAGNVVVAVENIDPEAIRAAQQYLTDDQGAKDVALIGASAGADATLQALTDGSEQPDQLILLSPNTVVDLPGSEPKLFVASEDEAVADVPEKLAGAAAGSDNDVLMLPGSAHAQNIFMTDQGDKLQTAVLGRLKRFGAAG